MDCQLRHNLLHILLLLQLAETRILAILVLPKVLGGSQHLLLGCLQPNARPHAVSITLNTQRDHNKLGYIPGD